MTEKERLYLYYELDNIAHQILSKISSVHWANHRDQLASWSEKLRCIAEIIHPRSSAKPQPE